MHWYFCLAWFLGGAILSNSLPHLTNGISGRAFQSPFAKPPGRGLSSSTVNVLWGFFNLAIAWLLLVHAGDFSLRAYNSVLPCAAGFLLMSALLGYGFGRFHGGR
ncbi:MAG TPA: hypothetical protein VMA34_04850 [Terracidiphilus sp.]|nr:hypothetical protein [Terracidiphilus sp.]